MGHIWSWTGKSFRLCNGLSLILTFRDLQKLIQSQSQRSTPSQYAFQHLRDKPFWYFDQSRHRERDRSQKGACCFNHLIGLPTKDGIRKPLFDYEGLLYMLDVAGSIQSLTQQIIPRFV